MAQNSQIVLPFLKMFHKDLFSNDNQNLKDNLSDVDLPRRFSKDDSPYNMARRVSIKSTGSHKFTVINYGKNANLRSQSTLEELKELRNNDDQTTTNDSPRINDCSDFRVSESGIWMGKGNTDNDSTCKQDNFDSCEIVVSDYDQCKDELLEEGRMEGDNSLKSNRNTVVNINDNTYICKNDKDRNGKINGTNKKDETNANNLKSQTNSNRNHAVVLQIEDFSDDALDENEEKPIANKGSDVQMDTANNSLNTVTKETLNTVTTEAPNYTQYNSSSKLPHLNIEFDKDQRLNSDTSFLLANQRNLDNSLENLSTLVESDNSTMDMSCPSPKSQVTHWKDTTLAKFGRDYSKQKTLRLVQQNGDCNVVYSKVDRRSVKYLNDLYTTLMETKWRYIISVYLLSFLLSWIFFALLWWCLHIMYVDDAGNTCVTDVSNFWTALLFSIETQSTIGYGSRAVTERCFLTFPLLMIQTVFGAVSQCIATGVIFSKLSRPSQRAETIIFSKYAVICSRDYSYNFSTPLKEMAKKVDVKDLDSTSSDSEDEGHLNLEFRVGDVRNSQLIGVRISAILVRKNFIQHGRQVELKQERLQISTESDDDFYFLAWPIKVIHRIDQKSPFWGTKGYHLTLVEFEILIVLEANCESTGGTMQVKTSYLPSELVWGARLEPLFTRPKYNGKYTVNYSRFHQIIPDPKMISEEEIEKVSNLSDTKALKRSKFGLSYMGTATSSSVEDKIFSLSQPLKSFSKFRSIRKLRKRNSYQNEKVDRNNLNTPENTETTHIINNTIHNSGIGKDKRNGDYIKKNISNQMDDNYNIDVTENNAPEVNKNKFIEFNRNSIEISKKRHRVSFNRATYDHTPCYCQQQHLQQQLIEQQKPLQQQHLQQQLIEQQNPLQQRHLQQQLIEQQNPLQQQQHLQQQLIEQQNPLQQQQNPQQQLTEQHQPKHTCNHTANIQKTPNGQHSHNRCPQHHHSHHQPKKFTHKPSYISLQSYDSLPSLAYEDIGEDEDVQVVK